MSWLSVLLLVAIVSFQIFVTYRVWKSEGFERKEKVAQSKLVWLIPLLGAVMVYTVIAEDDDSSGPSSHLRA